MSAKNSLPTTIALGVARGGLEIRQFMRQRESVVFTLAFPIILLAIFGSVFKTTIADGVTFSQYFVAGMIASGLVNTGFQQLAITIPMEREFGSLKRLRGTPMHVASYFIGKSILVFVSMAIQVLLLLAGGMIFFGVELPSDPYKWSVFTWLIVFGSAASTALGIAFAAVPKSGRGASAVVSPVVIILQFFSGVFFVFTDLPGWMQQVAAIFPLKWMTQGMRSVFLPDSFALREVAGTWETVEIEKINRSICNFCSDSFGNFCIRGHFNSETNSKTKPKNRLGGFHQRD
jgi:ABC-2 type transport system permease protein